MPTTSTLRVAAAIALSAIAATGVAQNSENLPGEALPGATADPADDPRFNERVSYCLGLTYGKRLKEDGVQVDFAAVVSGLRDALTDQPQQLTDQQIVAVMDRFQQLMQQRMEQRMASAADQNLAKGQEFLAANRSKEGVQETASGLQYREVEAGDGATPGPTDTVRCHYHGTLIDGTVFDSSYQRGEPAEFPVNRVIAGWTEALQMMKVGSKWEVYLPPGIAYGPQGAGGAIGPNETLIFTIELLDIVN